MPPAEQKMFFFIRDFRNFFRVNSLNEYTLKPLPEECVWRVLMRFTSTEFRSIKTKILNIFSENQKQTVGFFNSQLIMTQTMLRFSSILVEFYSSNFYSPI